MAQRSPQEPKQGRKFTDHVHYSRRKGYPWARTASSRWTQGWEAWLTIWQFDRTESHFLSLGQKPVRIGNGAADHKQLDIYGEIIDSLVSSVSRPCVTNEEVGSMPEDSGISTLTTQNANSTWLKGSLDLSHTTTGSSALTHRANRSLTSRFLRQGSHPWNRRLRLWDLARTRFVNLGSSRTRAKLPLLKGELSKWSIFIARADFFQPRTGHALGRNGSRASSRRQAISALPKSSEMVSFSRRTLRRNSNQGIVSDFSSPFALVCRPWLTWLCFHRATATKSSDSTLNLTKTTMFSIPPFSSCLSPSSLTPPTLVCCRLSRLSWDQGIEMVFVSFAFIIFLLTTRTDRTVSLYSREQLGVPIRYRQSRRRHRWRR